MALHDRLVLLAALSIGVAASGGASAQPSGQAPTKQAPKPPPPGPDLRVAIVDVAKVYDCAHKNDIVYRINVYIENVGNENAYIPKLKKMVTVRHKGDPRWSGTADFAHLAGNGPLPLRPGKRMQTVVFIKKFTEAPLVMKGGSQEFEAEVDHDSLIPERNEKNNVKELTAPAVNPCFTVF